MDKWVQVPAGSVTTQRKDVVTLEPGVEYRTMGVRWYGRGAYDRGVGTTSTIKAKRLFRAHGGDFVFNRIDTQNGAFDVVPTVLDGALATNEFPLYVADPDQLTERFLLLYFQQPSVLAQIDAMRAGSEGRSRWKEADFEAWKIPLPSLAEQRRIVDVMAGIDAQVKALQEEAVRAEALWWAIANVMIDELAGVHHSRLDAIAEVSGGLTKNKKDLEQSDLIEVPYLRVANVHRRYLSLRDVALIRTTRVKAEALRLQPGDILFNEGGDRDKLGRGDVWRGQIEHCIHQNHVFRARLTNPEFEPRFVSAWGNSFGKRWFETFGTQTTGIASINKRTLSRFPVPDIPRSDQIAWADRLDAAWQVEAALSDEIDRLGKFRAALLASLLNQEIEVPDAYDRVLEGVS